MTVIISTCILNTCHTWKRGNTKRKYIFQVWNTNWINCYQPINFILKELLFKYFNDFIRTYYNLSHDGNVNS